MKKIKFGKMLSITAITTTIAISSASGITYGWDNGSHGQNNYGGNNNQYREQKQEHIEQKKEYIEEKKEYKKEQIEQKKEYIEEKKEQTGQKNEFVEQKKEFIEQKKELLEQKRQLVKGNYTNKDRQELQVKINELMKTHKDIKVIPVENVLMGQSKFKFDTPPVIKQGRLIVPVRAITEGLGAEVVWNEKEQTVEIEKDGKIMTFALGSAYVYVDGVKTELDLPVQKMSGRIMIPLRFIAENFGLTVTHHDDTGIIDIEEDLLDTKN